jgi:transposase
MSGVAPMSGLRFPSSTNVNAKPTTERCIQFAPNEPSQNPTEDAWLQAKTWLRRMSGLKPCFAALKALFEQFFTLDVFNFPKLHMYGSFL